MFGIDDLAMIGMGVGGASSLFGTIGNALGLGGDKTETPYYMQKWYTDAYTLPSQDAFLRMLGFEYQYNPAYGYNTLVLKTKGEGALSPMPATQASLDAQKREEEIAVGETKAGYSDAMAMARRYGSIMMPTGGAGYYNQRIPLMMAEQVGGIRAAGGLERAKIVERGEQQRLAGIQSFATGQPSQPVVQQPGTQWPSSLIGLGQDLMGAGANLYAMNQLSGLFSGNLPNVPNYAQQFGAQFSAPSFMTNPSPTPTGTFSLRSGTTSKINPYNFSLFS